MEISNEKNMLGLSVVLALSACSMPRDANQPLEVWSNFENSAISTSNLGENQSLAVFYRQADVTDPAVNVYVNSDYQASLLPNAFTPVAVCADKNLFSASYSSNQQFGNRTNGVKYTLPVNQVTYVKVGQGSDGKITLTRMESGVAEQEIAKLPKENQTLPRVAAPTNCGAPVIAAVELDASALFAFNKFTYNDILPEGRKDIADFAEKVQGLTNVSGIKVSGHTDPMGTAQYNQELSNKRANTVKLALEKAGVTKPIQAQGFGETEPVVTSYGDLRGAAQVKCNQPNRRVEIAVYGTEK